MQTFGVEGMVRVSFALYNTYDEVDRLVEGLHRVVGIFKRQTNRKKASA